MSKKVKLGFLGCGYMGQLAHLTNYMQLDNCEVIAVCDVRAKQAELVAKRYGIPSVHTDYHEMLKCKDIDAIVASQPFPNHVNLVCDVLNAGKHLLTEKPLCIFPENGKKLAEAAAKNNKIHMVAYHKRSDPAIEYAMSLINSWRQTGEMGKMTYIRLSMPPGDWIGGADNPVNSGEKHEKYTPEANIPGIDQNTRERLVSFVNYYIHQVNLMRFLFGEDYELTYTEKSGVLLAAQSVSGVPGILEMAPYSTKNDWQEHALICFEKGWIRVDMLAPLASQQPGTVTYFTNADPVGEYRTPVLPPVSAMRNQAKNFVEAVAGIKKAPCESAEAVKDLEIAMRYIEMTK